MNGVSNEIQNDLNQVRRQPVEAGIKKKFSPVSITLYVDTTNSGIDNVNDACQFAAAAILQNFHQYTGGVSKSYARAAALSRYFFLKFFSDKRRYF